MMKPTLVTACLLIASNSAFADGSLQQTVREAVEGNPEVQASWHQFLASGQDVRAAESGYRPTVDVSARYGYDWQDADGRENYDGADASISLVQQLYDGFETRNDVQRFSGLELVRYHELLSSVQQTALEAYQAHTDVIRRRELVDLAEENLARHEEVYDKIIETVSAGIGRAADLEQISGRLALAKANLITEQANLHDVKSRYLRIVGHLPANELEPFALDESALPNSLDGILYRAYENNPAFHAAVRNIRAAESTVDYRKSAMKPRLNLTASYNTQTYDDIGRDNSQSDARIGLEVRYNLYRGGQDQAVVREAYQQVNVAKNQRDQECRVLRQNIQVAYEDIQSINSQLPNLNQHRLSSERVVAAYRDQFDIGNRTLLDVLDAENEAFQASIAYVNAVHDKKIAVARTLAATGDWLATVGVMPEGIPTLNKLGADPLFIEGENACPSGTPGFRDY